MKIKCAWCPDKLIREQEPLDDLSESYAICPECLERLKTEQNIPVASIPEELGNCDVTMVHDDGDLTVECGGEKFIVTTEGDMFKQVIRGEA